MEAVGGRLVSDTLQELIADFSIAAVKIGMLGSAEIARAVAAFLERHPMRNVVLDPVFKSSSGAELLEGEGVEVLRDHLLPLADVITPNIDEAAALTGLAVRKVEDLQAAAARLHELGAHNVVVTGGHLDPPVDLLSMDSGRETKVFTQEKIITNSTHGTGCAFATALACNLALGKNLIEATGDAQEYVTLALRNAIEMGSGNGPINHLFRGSN